MSCWKQFIGEFGYPIEIRVGNKLAEGAWLIAMHSISNPPFMKKVLALLKIPSLQGQVDLKKLAYLEGRIFEGKTQIFGTQFRQLSPYPIENPARVNELRERPL